MSTITRRCFVLVGSPPRCVAWACEANKDGLDCGVMIPLPVSAAWVDRMAVVDAAADAVFLDQLNAHGGGDVRGVV